VEERSHSGKVFRLTEDTVHVRVSDLQIDCIPIVAFAPADRARLVLGVVVQITIRRLRPDDTGEWEVHVIEDAAPTTYMVGRGASKHLREDTQKKDEDE